MSYFWGQSLVPSLGRLFFVGVCLSVPVLAGALPPAGAADEMRMVGSLGQHRVADDQGLPSFLIGDDMRRGSDERVILTGNAQVRQLDSVLKGDRIEYDEKTGEVDVQGNGMLMREGSIVRGPHLRYNVDKESGRIQAPDFWLGGAAGSGTADEAEIFSQEHVRLLGVRYNGCPCPEPAWYIDSSRVDLYFDENEGTARNGVLYFKGVPILYSPYLSFPISNERKSGFLLPTYGTSSNSGFELVTPYYLNLAPNYDATLYPRYLSKRGLLMGAEFRHLGRRSHSELFGTYMAKDNKTGDKRWMYSVQHQQSLGYGLSAQLDARKVSDDDYFRDFSSFGLTDSAVTYVRSQARLNWNINRYMHGSMEFYRYQTLQDKTGSFLAPPYDKLPELHFKAQRYGWHGLDIVSDNYATRFMSPRYTGNIAAFSRYQGKRLKPNGTRFSSYTTVARPFVLPAAYLTPKVGLHMSHYDTDWFEGDDWYGGRGAGYAGRPRSQSRVLPISSVDAGMTFERDAHLFGQAATQTLEPRLYYLYVPYRNQDDLPVYDTGLATFNFMQAYDENIFSGGWDRIANANQLTAGLTTRWLDADTGFERLSLSAAQRFYFADQKVTLNPSATPRKANESDYLLRANAALTDRFSVYMDGQFDSKTWRSQRTSGGVRWAPKRLASVAVNYLYERDQSIYYDPYAPITDAKPREQVSLSGQWPIGQNWYGVGRYDYSLEEKRNTQSILGVEYRGDCCWTARVVMQRYAVSREDTNTAMFFQLELSGLGALGTDPMSVLRDRITSYQTVTTPIPEKTVFERYE